MKRRLIIKEKIALMLVIAGLAVFWAVLNSLSYPADTEKAARRLGARLEDRMSVLIARAEHPERGRLPSDMVIYRYFQDTLVSWENVFPVYDDNINPRTIIPRIENSRTSFRSPLSAISDSPEFCNLGPKWYLARVLTDGDFRTVIGLEIVNTVDSKSFNGVNPRLRLGAGLSVRPLSTSGGSEVCVGGKPQFKIIYDTLSSESAAGTGLVWLSFVLLMVAGMLFLESGRTLKRLAAVASAIVLMSLAMYLWGLYAGGDLEIFSPVLFAGGAVLHSLGAVVIINLAILLLVCSAYTVKSEIYKKIERGLSAALAAIFVVLVILGVLAYTHVAVKSIILNSNICLDIYNVDEISRWTAVVYASFILMLLCIPLLLQMLQPALSALTGRHFNALSVRGRVVISLLVSLYFIIVSSVLGFRKEQDRAEVWANRLSVDRDIALEVLLKRVDNQIAGDLVISSLCFFRETAGTVLNLITEKYLFRVAQNYNISAFIINEDTPYLQAAAYSGRLAGGEQIAENCRFSYFSSGGMPRYDGEFLFYHKTYGLARLIVEIEPKAGNRDRGFVSPRYSYSRFRGGNLLEFKGSYAYPTKMEKSFATRIYDNGETVIQSDGYVHFVNLVTDDEAVVISRPATTFTSYLIEGVFVALVFFILISVVSVSGRRRRVSGQSYYKARIVWVVMVSLIMALVTMATVSVFFVYKRNNVNLNTIMSDKIGSVQVMVQDEIKSAGVRGGLKSSGMMEILENAARGSGSEIILYSTDGRFVMSTSRASTEPRMPRSRMDREAYENIVTRNKRYFIGREEEAGWRHYNMYAPIMGEKGNMIAIICSPYTGGETYDFEQDAAMHLLTVTMLFLILLFLTRFVATDFLERMFKPLSEMGRKMSKAGGGSLDYIQYDRKDELSSLVDAYNRMVTDLSESTRQLAQAERDKAWSGMARQVAHEIKNPLTPMKLQLQRIIRLKEKGEKDWQEKFDDVSRVVLEHIDILTRTADEFSTFARLYSEEYTEIDLGGLLQKEISMFEGREDLDIEYIGLENAPIRGPKPQLTRVFVNLINNAVQAVDMRADLSVRGHIIVSLRNSALDGWYDIVVEDNGPGVSEENLGKLFTPNFTTKNSGTGLGLAISRNVLERCGAVISYSKSFSLGGACFTVQYPKDAPK